MSLRQNKKMKYLIIPAALGLLFLALLISPTNTYFTSDPPEIQGIERLRNPDFIQGRDVWQWNKACWRSLGGNPQTTVWEYNPSNVTMSISGYDNSFYSIGVSQGSGPSCLWGDKGLNLLIDETRHNIITWVGSVDEVDIRQIGCLGVGINAWFDVQIKNGTNLPLEIFIFFYQDGTYALPVRTYKDYGYRGAIWYEGFMSYENHPMPWLYFYYHQEQMKIGDVREFKIELNDFLKVIRDRAGEPYSSGSYYLTRIDAVMELFMGSATFTVDKLSLIQADK